MRRSIFGSSRYVIRKNGTPDAPWTFEGDAWGDSGAGKTFEEVIDATANSGAWTPITDTRPYLDRSSNPS